MRAQPGQAERQGEFDRRRGEKLRERNASEIAERPCWRRRPGAWPRARR